MYETYKIKNAKPKYFKASFLSKVRWWGRLISKPSDTPLTETSSLLSPGAGRLNGADENDGGALNSFIYKSSDHFNLYDK